MESDEVLTIKQACEMLHVSTATLYRWIKEGWLPAHKIGRSTRFLRSEIIEAIRRAVWTPEDNMPGRGSGSE